MDYLKSRSVSSGMGGRFKAGISGRLVPEYAFIKRKLEGQYVIATIFTYRKRLFVKQGNKIIKSFSFPIKGHIVVPLLSIAKGKT